LKNSPAKLHPRSDLTRRGLRLFWRATPQQEEKNKYNNIIVLVTTRWKAI